MTDTVDTIGALYAEGTITRGQAELRLLELAMPIKMIEGHMEHFEMERSKRLKRLGVG